MVKKLKVASSVICFIFLICLGGEKIIDRFCFNIADYICIPIALIGIAFIIVGFIINKKSK